MGENYSLMGGMAISPMALAIRIGKCGNAAVRQAPDARERIPLPALFCAACIASHCILLTRGAADAAPLVSIAAAIACVTSENMTKRMKAEPTLRRHRT